MYGCLHSTRSLPEHTLFELASSFTPRVESLGSTTVILDLHGLGRAWPAPERLGRALLDAGHDLGIDPHVALASSRVVALIVARSCAGLTIVPRGQEATILAPLPLSALDLPPERRSLFERWGIETLGDLAAMPAVGLAERLGPEGPHLSRLARGEDRLPLAATAPPELFQCTLDLDWPVEGLEPLAFLLSRMLDPLCEKLRVRGCQASAMELHLRLVDGRSHRRTLRAAAPSREPRTWRTLLLLDLEGHPPGDAIQALTLHAVPTASRTVQFSLLDPAQPSPERLAETLAHLREWASSGRAGAALLLDTHRPGAFVLQNFAPGPWKDAGPSGPEPCVALRVFRPPLPANVVLRDGAPAFVRAPGIHGQVVDRAGPWRASGDWWDVAWSREEWDVALGGAGLFRIYRDRLRESWFVEGELD
jgi:protein ImuB